MLRPLAALMIAAIAVLTVSAPAPRAVAAGAAPTAPATEGEIGIVIGYGQDRFIKVMEVLAGGPAAQAGLKAGDRIERIDGALAYLISPWVAWGLLDGPLGSTVELQVMNGPLVRVTRGLTRTAAVVGWHRQAIARLEAEARTLRERRPALHQKLKVPTTWAHAAWRAHRAATLPTVLGLAKRPNGWHDGRALAKALQANDYEALIRLQTDEEDLDLLAADDPALLMLPVALHHLKLAAAILQAEKAFIRGHYGEAARLADLAASEDGVSYSSGADDFAGYRRHGETLRAAYTELQALTWREGEVGSALDAARRSLARTRQP